MIKQFIALIFGLCVYCIARADQCSSPIQSDLLNCLGNRVQVSDDELNATYKLVKSKIAPDVIVRLIAVQRTWIKFRDATCKAVPESQGGREAILESMACHSKLSIRRTKELEYIFGDGEMHRFYAHLCTEQSRRKLGFSERIGELAAHVNAWKESDWKEYVERNCQMSHSVLGEDMRTCYARQAFSRY